MLRLTPINGHDHVPTLRLEGKVQGPWVAELARTCEALYGSFGRLRLDLAAVSFVDESGAALLREGVRRGAIVGKCPGFVAELVGLEEL